MKLAVLLLLAAFSASAQIRGDLHAGMLMRIDGDGNKVASIEALYKIDRFAAFAEYEGSNSWLIAGRGYFAKHLFFQQALRNAGAPNPDHPWVLQEGIGFDGRVKMVRFIVIASPAVRVGTPIIGHTEQIAAYYYVRPRLAVRALFLESDVVRRTYQVGFGFNYVFHLGK